MRVGATRVSRKVGCSAFNTCLEHYVGKFLRAVVAFSTFMLYLESHIKASRSIVSITGGARVRVICLQAVKVRVIQTFLEVFIIIGLLLAVNTVGLIIAYGSACN